MALPEFISLVSTLQTQIPTFVGNGSKIEVPDLQVVFWGPYWPGTGELTVDNLMRAVNIIIGGPYLDGLKQYGFVGPVNLRQPIVTPGNPNITYPAPGPNVNQSTSTAQAVYSMIDTFRDNNTMGDVTSNHNLIVMTFLDPSVPFPQTFGPTGAYQLTEYGAHSTYEVPRILAPAVRFSFAWIIPRAAQNLSAFDLATSTFGHELAESITNPFVGSGWVQTSPQAGPNAGEIGDICNNHQCVVDGIVVQPYWGIQQAACILPTGTRYLSLSQSLTKHVSEDGPTQYAEVELGPGCGTGRFDYVERTWDNVVTIPAAHTGYQIPIFTWSINGIPLPGGSSTTDVKATWDLPPRLIDFSAFTLRTHGLLLMEPHGAPPPPPSAGAVGAAGHFLIPQTDGLPASSPMALEALFVGGVLTHAGVPAGGATGVANPVIEDGLHPNLATLHIAVFDSVMTIECGPGAGNVEFTVGCEVIENWDNISGTEVTTQQSTTMDVTMTNQEIAWGSAFQTAANNCYASTHKIQAGGGLKIPISPVDPGQVSKVAQVQQAQEVHDVQQPNRVKLAEQIDKLK